MRKTLLKFILGFSISLSAFIPSVAQQTTVGNNTFGGNVYGPMTPRTDSAFAYSRHAYIYPKASIQGLQHGDSIRQIEFYKVGNQTFNGNPTFRIFIGMSDTADWGPGNIQSWATEKTGSGIQKVFDGGVSSIVDATTGYKAFVFDSIFVFDTTKGENLKIMLEFNQSQAQTPGQVPLWTYENDISMPSFTSQNETKYVYGWGTAPDTTRFSQVRKPSIRLSHPRHDVNTSLKEMYALGEIATLMGPVDTIRCRLSNTGLKTLTNYPLEITISGANSYKDTVYLDTLQPFEERMVYFTSFKPTARGIDTLTVVPLNEKFKDDDTARMARLVSYNILSHNNPLITNNPFGIGFNQSSGDFVAKYYTDSNYINQVQIGFASDNEPFAVVIWQEDSNGAPGKEIYESDTLYSFTGTYIQPILPRVQVRGGYFVGIRQLGLNNIGFAYEPEIPVRPNSFYFTAPARDTNWTPFDPGFDFNPDIQPRIQVDHDVAVLSISYPIANDTFEFNINDSLAPKAIVYNYGYRNQRSPFDVTCEVRDQFGNVVYKSTKFLTIDAEDSVEVTFDNNLSLGNYGDLSMIVYTELTDDKAVENDTARSNFSIYVNYDLQIESFFEPQGGEQYEQNVSKVPPTVRVVNFGVRDQQNIRVTSRIRQDTNIAGEQTQILNLAGGSSQIVGFDSVTIPFFGEAIFEVFVWNGIDSFPINDTVRVKVDVVRSNDVGISSVIRPMDSSIYLRNQEFRPYINYRNFGLADQDSIVISASISDLNGTDIWNDTLVNSLTKLSSFQVLFKRFTAPDSAQTLNFYAYAWIAGDQNHENDTVRTQFFVKSSKDLALVSAILPRVDSVYATTDSIRTQVEVLNFGNNVIGSGESLYLAVHNENKQVVHQDTGFTTKGLLRNETDVVSFSKSYVPMSPGIYDMVIWANTANDGDRNNDTLHLSLEVRDVCSVQLSSVRSPQSFDAYQLNRDTVKPVIIIRNIGKSAPVTTVYINANIEFAGNTVYTVTDSIVSMGNATDSVVSLPVYLPPQVGVYTFGVEISNTDDAVTTDNSASNDFVVSLANDVGPTAAVLPEFDSLVFANRIYAPRAEFKNFGDSSQQFSFGVSYIIEFAGGLFYTSNKNITLNADATRIVTFDSTFAPKTPGIYTATIISRLGDDQVTENDTIQGEFEVDFHVSLETLESLGIKIYPNPVSDFIEINSELSIDAIRVYTLDGQLLKTKSITRSAEKIDVNDLASQALLIEVVIDGEQSKFVRLLKD